MYLLCRYRRSGVIDIGESISSHYSVKSNYDIALYGLAVMEVLTTNNVQIIIEIYSFITVLRYHISCTATDKKKL